MMAVEAARTAEITGIRSVLEAVCCFGELGRTSAEIFAGNVRSAGAEGGGGRGVGGGEGGEGGEGEP